VYVSIHLINVIEGGEWLRVCNKYATSRSRKPQFPGLPTSPNDNTHDNQIQSRTIQNLSGLIQGGFLLCIYNMIPGSKGHAFHACMKKHDVGTRKT